MATEKTIRKSALVALELDDLRARRVELEADLSAALTKYDDTRQGVISRTATMKQAQGAKSDFDAITEICADVDGQIGALETELESAEAGEARARKMARIEELRGQVETGRKAIEKSGLEAATHLQSVIWQMLDAMRENQGAATEMRFLADELNVFQLATALPYAFSQGHLTATLSESEIEIAFQRPFVELMRALLFAEEVKRGPNLYLDPMPNFGVPEMADADIQKSIDERNAKREVAAPTPAAAPTQTATSAANLPLSARLVPAGARAAARLSADELADLKMETKALEMIVAGATAGAKAAAPAATTPSKQTISPAAQAASARMNTKAQHDLAPRNPITRLLNKRF